MTERGWIVRGSLGLTALLAVLLVHAWPQASSAPSLPAPLASFTPPAAAHHPVRLALTARTSGDELALTILLERSSLYASLPAKLSVQLPAGVTSTDGATTVDLPEGTAVTHVLPLRVHGVPAEDVVVVVEIRGQGRTARGEARHRFGRPEPRLPDMARLPEARVRGGGSLGTRIKVTPVPR